MVTARRSGEAGTLILVGGHESAGGRELPPLPAQAGLDGVRVRVVAAGRELDRALEASAAQSDLEHPVVVLPMTLGRDPRLVSDTARTVRWVAAGQDVGRIAIAHPFGAVDHLVGWLRAACLALGDDEVAVLIAATHADPFDDAELYRVAALVRIYGRQRLVEVGFRSRSGGLEDGFERCRRLGAERVAVVPAEFRVRADVAAPLLSPTVIARIVTARLATARHRLAAHDDDGVAAALAADHQHGFAHSHEGGHAHRHTHPDDHFHDHSQLAVG